MSMQFIQDVMAFATCYEFSFHKSNTKFKAVEIQLQIRERKVTGVKI